MCPFCSTLRPPLPPLFPYTTLFRSHGEQERAERHQERSHRKGTAGATWRADLAVDRCGHGLLCGGGRTGPGARAHVRASSVTGVLVPEPPSSSLRPSIVSPSPESVVSAPSFGSCSEA